MLDFIVCGFQSTALHTAGTAISPPFSCCSRKTLPPQTTRSSRHHSSARASPAIRRLLSSFWKQIAPVAARDKRGRTARRGCRRGHTRIEVMLSEWGGTPGGESVAAAGETTRAAAKGPARYQVAPE